MQQYARTMLSEGLNTSFRTASSALVSRVFSAKMGAWCSFYLQSNHEKPYESVLSFFNHCDVYTLSLFMLT